MRAIVCATHASASDLVNFTLAWCATSSSGRAAAHLVISPSSAAQVETPAPDSTAEAEDPGQAVCARTARFPHVEACCGVGGEGCPHHVWLHTLNESMALVAGDVPPPWVALVARFARNTVALTTTMAAQGEEPPAPVASDNPDAVVFWSVGTWACLGRYVWVRKAGR